VNQYQPIGNVSFVESLTLCSAVHVTFAVIKKSFQQEKLKKGVALILINLEAMNLSLKT